MTGLPVITRDMCSSLGEVTAVWAVMHLKVITSKQYSNITQDNSENQGNNELSHDPRTPQDVNRTVLPDNTCQPRTYNLTDSLKTNLRLECTSHLNAYPVSCDTNGSVIGIIFY